MLFNEMSALWILQFHSEEELKCKNFTQVNRKRKLKGTSSKVLFMTFKSQYIPFVIEVLNFR